MTAAGVAAELPPGKCNLYRYPCVLLRGSDVEEDATGAQLLCLRSMVIGLCTAVSAVDPTRVVDPVGATLIHGLLISNSDAAVTPVFM